MTEPSTPFQAKRPVPAVGVACFRDNAVLLIRRGAAPRLGEWSLPGGKIEWGEPAAKAALRELEEETSVNAELIGLVDVVDGLFRSRGSDDVWAHYVLVDYAALWISGEPVAGDDASEAAFFTPQDLETIELWPQTRRIIDMARSMIANAP